MPINNKTDSSTVPPVTFGPAFDTFLQWLGNVRASHPTYEIYLWEDGVLAFLHNKYHPDVICSHRRAQLLRCARNWLYLCWHHQPHQLECGCSLSPGTHPVAEDPAR
jgi:hypothetical protein